MTLTHLLSAVRELILDKEATSDTPESRRIEFAKRFPQLGKEEIGDLAAIAPERMHVYTELIYNGELSMLRWIYPITFAVLSRINKVEDDVQEQRNYFNQLVRELHRFRAWRSDSSRLLAANFQEYVIEKKPDLQQAWPGLDDLIDYEKTSVEVFYALDVPHQEITVQQLGAFSVGELMDLPVFVPAYVAMKIFQHDVLQVGSLWRNADKLPDCLPGPSEKRAVCGRDAQTLMPKWLAIDDATNHTLRHLSSLDALTLNDVATVYLQQQSWPEDQTEESQFHRFFLEIVDWFSAGVVCVPT